MCDIHVHVCTNITKAYMSDFQNNFVPGVLSELLRMREVMSKLFAAYQMLLTYFT